MTFSQRAGRCAEVLGLVLVVQTRAGALPAEPPFAVPATFQSPLRGSGHACGTDETLTLRANRTFVVRFAADRLELSESSGSWRYDARSAKLIMNIGGGIPAFFYRVVRASVLDELGPDRNPTGSSCIRRLARSSRVIEFSGEMQPIDLWSDRWTFAGFDSLQAALLAGTRAPNLTFHAATKRVSGWTGCNQVSGTYERAGTQLTFSPLVTTSMACAPPLDGIEARFLHALERTTSYHICCWTLELRAGSKVLATFRALR